MTAKINTDKELWRESEDHYSPSIHVTKDGRIGINVGGLVIENKLRGWHEAVTNGGWTNARISPPLESGNYWCVTKDPNREEDKYWQANCHYHPESSTWTSDLDHKTVTHWMPLVPMPTLLNRQT